MAGAFSTCFEVVGVDTLARSWFGDYTGPRLPWMATVEARPTKHWTQGPSGLWYRNGLAKNHLNMALCGLAVPLALDRANRIALTAETRTLLGSVLVRLVRRLVDGGYRIREPDGEPTEYGDLRPGVAFGATWPTLPGLPNGFNRLIVLNGLRAASYLDSDLAAEYERRAPEWLPGVKLSMTAAGEAMRCVGHHRFDKPSFSDMQAFATAAASYLLQEPRRELRRDVTGALHGLWAAMQYENQPPFALAYSIARPADARIPWVVRLLRYFPGTEGKWAFAFRSEDSSHYQPIENRPPNSNYWKSSPFRRALMVDPSTPATNPETGDPQAYAGADYLYAYWFGRFLERVPER
jgi:hypothetical protein